MYGYVSEKTSCGACQRTEKRTTLHLAVEEVPWLTTDGWTPSSSSNLILIRKRNLESLQTSHSTTPFQDHSSETILPNNTQNLKTLNSKIPLVDTHPWTSKKPKTHFLLHFTRLNHPKTKRKAPRLHSRLDHTSLWPPLLWLFSATRTTHGRQQERQRQPSCVRLNGGLKVPGIWRVPSLGG